MTGQHVSVTATPSLSALAVDRTPRSTELHATASLPSLSPSRPSPAPARPASALSSPAAFANGSPPRAALVRLPPAAGRHNNNLTPPPPPAARFPHEQTTIIPSLPCVCRPLEEEDTVILCARPPVPLRERQGDAAQGGSTNRADFPLPALIAPNHRCLFAVAFRAATGCYVRLSSCCFFPS